MVSECFQFLLIHTLPIIAHNNTDQGGSVRIDINYNLTSDGVLYLSFQIDVHNLFELVNIVKIITLSMSL